MATYAAWQKAQRLYPRKQESHKLRVLHQSPPWRKRNKKLKRNQDMAEVNCVSAAEPGCTSNGVSCGCCWPLHGDTETNCTQLHSWTAEDKWATLMVRAAGQPTPSSTAVEPPNFLGMPLHLWLWWECSHIRLQPRSKKNISCLRDCTSTANNQVPALCF